MALLRLLVLIGLIYFLYRVLRKFLSPPVRSHRWNGGGTVNPMVQDPYCKTYIPLKDAIKKSINGEDFYFCSMECYEKFEQNIKRGKSL